MTNLVNNTIGLIHLLSSLTALLLGTIMLAGKKGTRLHKCIGYCYVIAMLILIVTAFSIYHLFGKFGPFHYAALLSLAQLITGFLPAIVRSTNWIRWHVAGMYNSVIGLYAAFISEIVTRIPGLPFFWMVTAGTALVMIVGVTVFILRRKAWMGLHPKTKN